MRRRKSRFLLFCWSFLPGAGQMYMGFMKMGVSLMGSFMLMTVGVSFSRFGILSVIPLVIWFYSFFHANNLGGLLDEELNSIKDNYLFFDDDSEDSLKASVTGKYRKAAAAALIIIGTSMLWDVLCDILYKIFGKEWFNMYFKEISNIVSNQVPRVIIGMVIIWFGVKLIRGKKEELDRLEEKEDGYKAFEAEKKDE